MRKTISPNDGDIVLIKLNNESYAVSQIIIGGKDSVLIAVTNKCINSKNDLTKFDEKDIISISFVTTNHFNKGLWEIIGNKSVVINKNKLKHKDCSEIGAISYTSPMYHKFINAYFGLHPWNCYFDPNEFDKMLLEGVERPKNIILE